MNFKLHIKKMFICCFIAIITFIFCTDTTQAAKPYRVITTNNLQEECNNTTNCLNLCIYDVSGSVSSSGKSYIGYYIDKSIAWQIGSYSGPDQLNIFEGSIIPNENIYWENTGDWKNSEGYSFLNDSLTCPNYMYTDSVVNTELCFANYLYPGNTNTGTGDMLCYEKNDPIPYIGVYVSTGFEDAQVPIYSFAEEMKTVIDQTYDELTNMDTDEKKLQFFSEVTNNFEYNESLSADDNFKNNCNLMENLEGLNLNNQNIMTYEEQKINPTLKKYAKDSINVELYTRENLIKILTLSVDEYQTVTARPIYDASNKLYYDKLSEIYVKNLETILPYIKEKCSTVAAVDLELNNDEIISNAQDIINENNIMHIDIYSQFECSDIFTEDIISLIKDGYFVIEIGAVIILVVFSVLDYAKVILNGNQDEFKKVNQRLLKRLIIVVIIFLLPALVNLVLRIFNIEGFNSENPLCIESINK